MRSSTSSACSSTTTAAACTSSTATSSSRSPGAATSSPTREEVEALTCRIGEGITGRVAETGESILLANALDCDFAVTIPGTEDVDESIIAVPLHYGTRVIGAIVISKLGVGQFDEDDVRLLEVLGHASVALENARLYEAERLEARRAKASLEISNALLDFSRRLASPSRSTRCSNERSSWPRACSTSRAPPSGCRTGRRGSRRPRALRLRLARRGDPARTSSFRTSGPARSSTATSRSSSRRRSSACAEPPSSARGRFAVAPLRLDGDRSRLHRRPHGATAREPSTSAQHAPPRRRRAPGEARGHERVSFESLERTFLSTVEALANALEANDQYTSSHARWITDMALHVGRELGMDAGR